MKQIESTAIEYRLLSWAIQGKGQFSKAPTLLTRQRRPHIHMRIRHNQDIKLTKSIVLKQLNWFRLVMTSFPVS